MRFGNVLGSRGSVVPTFVKQIEQGGPVTITHPDASRCFATVEEAVALTLEAAHMATGGEIHTLDLAAPMKITEVVSRFIRQYKLPEVPIRYVADDRPHSEEPAPTNKNASERQPLPDYLDKLYKAAAKNRDPKVRQMLAKLAHVQNAGARASLE